MTGTVIPIIVVAATLTAEVHTLSLKQAVDLALKQNPDLLLARFDEVRAQQAIREAKDPFHPKMVIGSGLAYSSGFPLSIEGSAPSIIRGDATQTLFNRQRSYEVAKVREQARGAAITTQARRDDAALRTALQYLEVDRLRRAAEVAQRQTESIEKMAEITRIRVAEGRELELENKRTAARLAQARHRARVLEGSAHVEEEGLALLLGFPSGDQVRPIAEERPLPKVPDSEEEVARGALESSKDLRVLQSKMQAAGLDIKANQAARLPKIDLVAQYGLFAKFNNYDDFFRRFQRHNGQIGVSFQLPILPGSAASSRADQASSESARLRLEMAAARSRISLNARRAFQDLKNAESFREVARLDLEAAREQLAVSMAQYEEGRAPLKLVEDSRILENERWMAFLDAQFSVEKLRLTVLKENGELLAALN